ncbi:PLP-dependent aminotransferase family protein [Cytobacillus kochii]|uniref:aminotransferase-like domain-containing protein n=1 Tax=Cytobacillus kochii TaxID=859143 RepID=UPI002E20B656|nr:PLP-dependent aminotransferase family protein [Cytobacillus kochii]
MNIKYKEIVAWVRHQLDAKQLKVGDKLPSIRSLAQQFQCSKNTVSKALAELEKLHIVYAKPKSGYYVVDFFQTDRPAQDEVDFLSAGPDQRIMPYEDFQHCMNQAIEHYKEELFTYSDRQGLFSLRVELTKYLQHLQVFTIPERLVITSGSQQALQILAVMPFPNGKTHVLIEDPTYFGMLETLKLNHVPTIGLPLSMEGIDFEQLEHLFRTKKIKFFYVIPRCHNPLGHHYSNSEKRKIVELAEKYDIYIVEDDFLAELDTDTKADPLFTYEPNGRVIYLKSFSKVFLPGLRIATVVLPENMIVRFIQHKFSADFNTSALSQGALEIYLKNGMFRYHLEKVQQLYTKKMQLLLEACERYLPDDIQYSKPNNGFYMTINIPSPVDAKQLIEQLKEKHIFVDHATEMYWAKPRPQAIRLSISQVDEAFICDGIQEIASQIQLLKTIQFNPLSFRFFNRTEHTPKKSK